MNERIDDSSPSTCSALPVEQPTRITEDGHLFFLRGYSGGFAAEYGVRLTRDEYEAAIIKQIGPGNLVETDGVFAFKPNDGCFGMGEQNK